MNVDDHLERNKFIYLLVGLFLVLWGSALYFTIHNPAFVPKFYDYVTSKADMCLGAFLGFITGNVVGKAMNGNGNGNGSGASK